MSKMPEYSSRVLDALKLAMELHGEQRRKGTDIPYVTHLWAVAAIVGEHGGTEDQIIAALLHDSIEDQGDKINLKAIGIRFGGPVAEIVAACTDSDRIPKPPWRERKERYLAHLWTAPPHVKLVSAADKLHNARAIVADLRQEGPEFWKRFNAGPEEQLWYYRELVQALRQDWPHRLVEELERMVAQLAALCM